MPSKKRLITAEDLYDLQILNTPRISPDGTHVIYSLQRVDRKTEKKYSNLWIVPTGAQGKPRQFTHGDQSDNSPSWSPDGSTIAFLSNRGDPEKPAQVYMIPFGGGEARKLTDIPGSISSFKWSPDGKQLLLTVTKTDPEVLEREKDEQKKKLGVVARHYDRLFYKLDDEGYRPIERQHLWTVDAATGRAKQLTDHAVWDENYPAWSPDGKSIAFITNRAEDPDQELDRAEIFILSIKDGEQRQIELPIGHKDNLSFSPDGRWLAYFGIEGENVDYKNNSLWIVPTDGSAPTRNLLEQYDIIVDSEAINDLVASELMDPTWSNDGSRIYFQIGKHGTVRIMSIDCSGEHLQYLVNEKGVASGFTFDQEQTRLAYSFSQLDDLWQVHVLDLKARKDTQLTRHNRDLLDKIDLGTVEEHWIEGRDGNPIQGWILTPPGFDPAKKYPSILEIHGGPQTQYGFNFMHEFYYLASKGFVVSFCNPRGGSGYGEAHTKAIFLNWGDADYADIMSWADFVARQPYIDPQKMGVCGGSYGGYMTVWIIGHTDRFAAAVPMRCVSNFLSMWGSSDFNWAFEREISNKPPFEDLQTYWKFSPIAYIGNAKTPTLVIHSEFDLRCPIEQGEQVFVALKRLGVDTEMVRFPDEFHGLSRTGRTDRKIARLNHILRWFEKYLKYKEK